MTLVQFIKYRLWPVSRARYNKAEALRSAYEDKLRVYMLKYNGFCALMEKYGYLCLSCDSASNTAVFLADEGGGEISFKMYYQSNLNWDADVAKAQISLKQDRTAFLVELNSTIENRGLGTILMKSVIRFLKLAGYASLNGCICPTDLDHEDKLRHFYGKFGFEITDLGDKRRIRLALSPNTDSLSLPDTSEEPSSPFP